MSGDEFDKRVINTQLEDGRQICIRSIRPSDEENMRAGIDQLSKQSRYLRFFSGQPTLPDSVIDNLVAVDGHNHIAWGAILTDNGANVPMGAVHAVRGDDGRGTGEFSVAIVDAYHGLGLARMLTAVILVHCRIEGITALEVQILSENTAAMGFVQTLAGEKYGSDAGVLEYRIDIDHALQRIQHGSSFAGLNRVLAVLRR
jgi:ribosomal protein S18 acetylase RimI-like enzyme